MLRGKWDRWGRGGLARGSSDLANFCFEGKVCCVILNCEVLGKHEVYIFFLVFTVSNLLVSILTAQDRWFCIEPILFGYMSAPGNNTDACRSVTRLKYRCIIPWWQVYLMPVYPC
jgi:hypothetical protein